MAKKKNPVLSIGMIVKDEIRTMERCLCSLAPLRKAISCELVIADTGSCDGTREIAAEYADVLFDFEWINDFSAARNAVLDRCSGTWCLVIDADEILDENIAELCAFLKEDSQKKNEIMNVIVRNYNSREMRKNDGTDFAALRLFRLDRGFRYNGIIHEAIRFTNNTACGCLSSVVLHHDGYAQRTNEEKTAHQEKCQRNLQLLEKKLASGGEDDPLIYMQMIEATHDMESRRHNCELGYRYLQRMNEKKLNTVEKALACRIIACWILWQDERVFPFLQTVLPQIETHFLYLCDISFFASRYYEGEHEYEKVLFYCLQYEKAIQMYDKGEYEESSLTISTSSCTYIKERLGQQLITARAYFKTGDVQKAEETLQSVCFEHLFPIEHLFRYYLNVLLEMAELPFAQEQAKAVFAKINALEKGEPKEQVFSVVRQLLIETLAKNKDDSAWQIFSHAPEEFGISVQVMRTKDVLQLQALLKQVNEWNNISALALYRAIECHCPLPSQFYEQGFEPLQKLVAFFILQQNAADSLLCWAAACKDESSLGWLRFTFQYCAMALQKGGNSADEYNALCRLFVRTADVLSTRLYHPDFLKNQSEWCVLPNVEQFALLLLLAKNALLAKDELQYVRILHEGLQVAPFMKGFVAHLSDPKHHLAAFPPVEMAELAMQLKGLLAQFAQDDAGVSQLKESEAYKMVASLVETNYLL